ncbi:hypothetical protein ACM66T_04935 [Sulfurimonas sp. ST-25]|uniref:hypothetical protein n=1 Tax=Sulfurimonas sp. ST-25 TaxID=3400151 RepID=UPI003A872416
MKIKLNFLTGALLTFIGTLIGAGVWVIEHHGFPKFLIECPLLGIAPHIIIPVVAGAFFRFVPLGSFDERKVSSFNTLSWYKTVEWGDVVAAKKLNWLIVSYILLYTKTSKWAVWVPLNITKRKQLIENMTKSGNESLTKLELT